MQTPGPSSTLEKHLPTWMILCTTGEKKWNKSKCLPTTEWKNKVEYNTQWILLLTSTWVTVTKKAASKNSSVVLSTKNRWETFNFKISSSHIRNKKLVKLILTIYFIQPNISTVIISTCSQYKNIDIWHFWYWILKIWCAYVQGISTWTSHF